MSECSQSGRSLVGFQWVFSVAKPHRAAVPSRRPCNLSASWPHCLTEQTAVQSSPHQRRGAEEPAPAWSRGPASSSTAAFLSSLVFVWLVTGCWEDAKGVPWCIRFKRIRLFLERPLLCFAVLGCYTVNDT